MSNRPILRFPEPRGTTRRTGSPRNPPRPRSPGRERQSHRFQSTFDRLSQALESRDSSVLLRSDPTGIAPERALVFVTAGSVQNFARAASGIGLELFSELDLEALPEFPEGFEPPGDEKHLSRTLYATMPTLSVLHELLRLWAAYKDGDSFPRGDTPWRNAFDQLLEIRCWGPQDRLTESAALIIQDRLPDDDEELPLEIEIWPTANSQQRADWRAEVEQRVTNLGGHILDRSSISQIGFSYEAILASLPGPAIRSLLADPSNTQGLAVLEGIQLILPQTIGQAAPGDPSAETAHIDELADFNAEAPIRAALLDGTPVAAHEAIADGIVVEDIHDLERLSPVNERYHATAMASLILRGDLRADNSPLTDSRLVSVPVLQDSATGAWSPKDKLFVDVIHTTLTRIFSGLEPLAPDVFVVNFSIGVTDLQFAGRISSLARLLDWWAEEEGILFVISAGNVPNPLHLFGTSYVQFEDADLDTQQQTVRASMRASVHSRTLLAPAESLNGITVGAISKDLDSAHAEHHAGYLNLSADDDLAPQVSSALGLGLHRSVKPDFLAPGGLQEVRVRPVGDSVLLYGVEPSQRTGLNVASPRDGTRGSLRIRGTSPAAALTTRAVLQSADALTTNGGPYEGLELPRKILSLLTRALAVNSARWPESATDLYYEVKQIVGSSRSVRAKEQVSRQYGYGTMSSSHMLESPENGVTLVGYGTIRKDQAKVFRMPLPPSMEGERVPRSMRITVAWYSPVNPARAQYRLASLEAVAAGSAEAEELDRWGLNLKPDGPDANMIKKGSVWSKRMIQDTQAVPKFDASREIPICVQCRDAAGGGLSPDDDIDFALVVTLEVEAEVQYDVHDEVEQQIRLRLQRDS